MSICASRQVAIETEELNAHVQYRSVCAVSMHVALVVSLI